MMVFVDTSAFYAVLDRDDENHRAARAIWQKLLGGETDLVTSNYVLVETCALVQHRLGVQAVRTFQEDVTPLLTIEWIAKSHHETAMASVLATNRRKLSLVDCTSFVLMRGAAIQKAFAFDQHFVAEGFDCKL